MEEDIRSLLRAVARYAELRLSRLERADELSKLRREMAEHMGSNMDAMRERFGEERAARDAQTRQRQAEGDIAIAAARAQVLSQRSALRGAFQARQDAMKRVLAALETQNG